MTSPDGGEKWFAGTSHNITWNSGSFLSNFVDIEYSVDSGATWTTVTVSTTNDGSFPWVLPNTPSTQSLVRIKESGNPTAFDISDSLFTIAPHITVTAPNGGEVKTGCEVQTISWEAGGTSNIYKIEFSADSGATWTTIISNFSSSSNNPTYNWTIPNEASDDYLIKVSDIFYSTRTDVSDAVFTVVQTTNVVLGTPNGGENWKIGSTQQINYAVDGGVGNVKLEYSINDGLSWTSITTSTNGGTYNWSVPNTASTTALVKVTDISNSCNSDVSNANFTIQDHITITTPNGLSLIHI